MNLISNIKNIEYNLKSYVMDYEGNYYVYLRINNISKKYKFKYTSKGKYIIYKGKRYYDNTIISLNYN